MSISETARAASPYSVETTRANAIGVEAAGYFPLQAGTLPGV